MKLRNTRNTRKGLVDKSLVLNPGVVSEVDQEPELLAGRFQVVDHLSTVLVSQLLDCLDLDDDLLEAQEVRLILLFELPTLVLKSKSGLLHEGDLLFPELNGEAFLVHGLQESVALFLVHLEACADDPVALFLEDDSFSHFSAFRVFRSSIPRTDKSFRSIMIFPPGSADRLPGSP